MSIADRQTRRSLAPVAARAWPPARAMRLAVLCVLLAAGATVRAAAADAAADAPVAVATPIVVPPADLLTPNPNLRADGLPPISKTLADRVAAFTEFSGHRLLDLHPLRREALVTHRAPGRNVPQLYRVSAAEATPESLTDFPEPIFEAAFDRVTGRSVFYLRDAGGNEATQVWRMDLDTRQHERLSSPDEKSRFVLDRRGVHMLVLSLPLDRTAAGGRRDTVTTRLTLLDATAPADVSRARVLAELPGGGWEEMAFSPDGKRIAAINYRTPNDTELWLIDVASGERRKVLPGDAATPGVPLGMQVAAYDGPVFAPDGRRLFLATNAGSEFRRLAVLDLATGALTPFGPTLAWDVESMDLSADGSQLAVVHNVDGVDELRILDAATGQVTAKPPLPPGRISALQWHARQAAPLAFGLATARTPGQMMLLDTATGALDRWTVPIAQVDPSGFAFAQVVRWKSFDGRTISGLLTLPPADRFPGPRPVLVAIHGGPEGQAKAGFAGRLNYLINELGIALLEPNVRGSSGYGRTFVDLDNGVRREDSVRDIGSLLDWIATEPRLDAKRVAVQGGSYGGYMVLASLVLYSDRLRGGIDVVGISDFVSFLNNTESYRRDLRRVEYGDERDPAVRKVLEAISPLRNADRITAPLFVVHGRNDPRVPYTEAEQIVAKVRSHGVPVWYLLADNEGHGFARKANADFAFYAMVRFLDTVLLRAGAY